MIYKVFLTITLFKVVLAIKSAELINFSIESMILKGVKYE